MRHLFPCIFAILFLTYCTAPLAEYNSQIDSFPQNSYLQISGIYPHQAVYNHPDDSLGKTRHRECGIGAVVPWAGKLWYMTYPPHQRTGSNDKLYSIDPHMSQRIHPNSVGGTHANRMIHEESQQLIMGPYFIDSTGQVRTADVMQLEGRMTATTRHLFEPETKVYFYEMEGAVYEVDVYTLEVKKLFEKPVPGWHGKGAYVGQNHFIVANNGEHPGHSKGYKHLLVGEEAKSWEEAGVLAEWDGDEWKIVERKPFTDVRGPGDLLGNKNPDDPVWSMGWDKASVLLKLRDQDKWYTYRLPKASHTFDPRHGWFTEWPRIRSVSPTQMMMVMHGSFFHFPKTFSAGNTSGIRPIASHLRYIPDFAIWNDKLILAADDASTLENPIVGQPQSNIWWGSVEELSTFGPKLGWGGLYIEDSVKADEPSDPYLLAGYEKRVFHLTQESSYAVNWTLEIDEEGNGNWKVWKNLTLERKAYHFEILPESLKGSWIRIRSDKAVQASAYFHYSSSRESLPKEESRMQGIASFGEKEDFSGALIRPAGHNKSLQIWDPQMETYWEANLNSDTTGLTFSHGEKNRSEEVLRLAALSQKPFEEDEASIIVKGPNGEAYRLPKSPLNYRKSWPLGFPRALREVQSERYLANIHGTFYEIPRAEGAGNNVPDYQKMKPVSTHNRRIVDYCSWRGLLVLSGINLQVPTHDNLFINDNIGLWMGMVDDVWKLGKPRGKGGPWLNSPVEKDKASDPYLFTGYDRKNLQISHSHSQVVEFLVEVSIAHGIWVPYKTFEVRPGEKLMHEFPSGYQAHWIRLSSNTACQATALLEYE